MRKTVTTTQMVAKEGYKYLIASFVAVVLAAYWGFGALGMALVVGVLLYTAYFFRNPERISEDDSADAIIAPSDGVIVSIEREYEESFLQEDRVTVTIASSLKDAHFIRAPFASSFRKKSVLHGLFLPVKSEKAKYLNERFAAYFDADGGKDFVISVIAGSLSTKIAMYMPEGSRVRGGERTAFLKSEFQTSLYLPVNAVIKKTVGDKVKAGETLIGYFASERND